MVVPVLEDAAALAAADALRAGTEADLHTPSLIEWIDAQVVMEGPTARECLLYSMIDDDEQDVYFRAYGRIIAAEESTRHVLQRMLSPYDPSSTTGRGSPRLAASTSSTSCTVSTSRWRSRARSVPTG
jgi:hypothetical protein